MFTLIYLGVIAFSCLITLSNWRSGLYCLTLLAVIRDPCRKLQLLTNPDQDRTLVFIGLAMNILWPCMLLGVFSEKPAILNQIGNIKALKTSYTLLILALIPAAMVSTFLYIGGWKVALIGFASYAAPIIGVLIGFAYINQPQTLYRFFIFYIFVNTIAITSCFWEYAGYDHPLLGGINMEWIRYRQGYIVDLMSGTFRSPDILGLHAAHVVMFCMLLLMLKSTRQHWFFFLCMLVGVLVLLLCGRRKMLAIPLVYLVSTGYILYRRKLISTSMMTATVVILGSMIVGISFLTQSGYLESDYTEYASSLATESIDRTEKNLIGGALESIQRSGILGSGLGTATQGRYYVKTNAGHQFNEDGFSRLFAEFGLAGIFFVMISIFTMIRFIFNRSSNTIHDKNVAFLIAGLFGIVTANMASFAYSHQAYSGDPNALMMVAFFMGIISSAPQYNPLLKSNSGQT